MYIFFLGVVPTVSLFLFFTYYWKQNRPSLTTRKSTTVYVETTEPIANTTSPTLNKKRKLQITDIKLNSTTNQHALSNSITLLIPNHNRSV